jgi:hypothetical protein
MLQMIELLLIHHIESTGKREGEQQKNTIIYVVPSFSVVAVVVVLEVVSQCCETGRAQLTVHHLYIMFCEGGALSNHGNV